MKLINRLNQPVRALPALAAFVVACVAIFAIAYLRDAPKMAELDAARNAAMQQEVPNDR